MQFYTLDKEPAFQERVEQLSDQSWPTFLLHGNVTQWDRLFDTFAPFQIICCNRADKLVAAAHSIPFPWDGTLEDLPRTIEQILVRALQAQAQRQPCNTLSALAAMVDSGHRRQGLSAQLLGQMKSIALAHGLGTLLAPVRPTHKQFYPLTRFEKYVGWKRADGSAFDPWIRVHANMGARPLQVMPEALTVTGTVQQWEQWTGMAFPETGPYVVPGALQPVSIDRELNQGRYDDPNFWMQHPVKTA